MLSEATLEQETAAESLSVETLRRIDVKVIKYVRLLATDPVAAERMAAVAQTAEPVEDFGEKGATYFRTALTNAKACVEMLRGRQGPAAGVKIHT